MPTCPFILILAVSHSSIVFARYQSSRYIATYNYKMTADEALRALSLEEKEKVGNLDSIPPRIHLKTTI